MRYFNKIIERYVPLLLSIIGEFSSKRDLLGRLNGDFITCRIADFTLFQDILGKMFVFMVVVVMMMTVFVLLFL